MRRSRRAGRIACAAGNAVVGRRVREAAEEDGLRRAAMTQLGNGLAGVNKHEERIAIIETELSTQLRVFPKNELDALDIKHNLARCYLLTGRLEEAARLGQTTDYDKLTADVPGRKAGITDLRDRRYLSRSACQETFSHFR